MLKDACLVALLAPLVLCGPRSLAQDEEVADATVRDWFSGDLELGLDVARTSEDGDIELDQVLRLKMDPPKRERLHFQTTLWTIEDLDGPEESTSTLRTINDASDSSVQARLLSLYMEVDDLGGDSTLRLGRQRIVEGVVYNRIDGGFYKWRNRRWEVYGFGGARASIYEDAHGDYSVGAGASVRLPTKTRLGVDYFYGEDDRRTFEGDEVASSLTAFSVRQQLATNHSLYARATWFDTDLDEVRLSAQGLFSAQEIVYTLSYRNQLSPVADRVTDITEFYRVLGELNEYQDAQALLSIPVTKRFTLGLEGQVHEAENSSETTGNRDYFRVGTSFDFYKVLKHYDLSVYLNYWDSEFGEGQVTITGEVTREWAKVKATLGLDYDRFQDRLIEFDETAQEAFTVESREDIYSAYARVRYTINDQHALRFYTIFEEDDGPDSPYWRLRAEYVLSF